MGWHRLDVPITNPNFGKLVRCPNQVHQPGYIERLARLSGLVEEDLEIRLDHFREQHYQKRDGDELCLVSNRDMLEKARAFIADPYGFLYLWGGPGNAKTDVLIAIVNEINMAPVSTGVKAVYLKFSKLVEYMRESYIENERRKANPDAPASYSQRLEEIKHVQVLAIDEFDFDGEKLRETAFAKEFRFDFLDDRYHLATRGRTATVFASNSPVDRLPDAIYDRFKDGRFQIVHNSAPSSRPAMKRQAA